MDLIPLRVGARPDTQTAERAGQRFIAACGLGDSPDVRQMRQLDAKLLVTAASNEITLSPGLPLLLKPLSLVLGPAVDGHVIPDNPHHLFSAGREHQVPLIIGSTREEMSLFLITARTPTDQAAYLKTLTDDFGDFAAPIAQAYPVHDASQIRSAALQLATDLSFTVEARDIARAHAAAGNKSFRYQFSRGTQRSFLRFLGAHHGADVPFVFQRPAEAGQNDLRISQTIGQYWTHFAATGDPNAPGLPRWPAYRADEEWMIDFAENVHLLQRDRTAQLDLIEKFLRSRE
jgi:para-nitrobenzyl esterase